MSKPVCLVLGLFIFTTSCASNSRNISRKEKQDDLLSVAIAFSDLYIYSVKSVALSYSSVDSSPAEIADAAQAACAEIFHTFREASFDYMDVASTRCTPQARNRYFGEIDKQCQQLAKRARQEAIRVVIEDRIKGKSEPRRPGQIADNGGLKGFGSGFIITSDGYLLTNDHVVKDSNRVMIKTETGVMPARIVMSDPDNDIALLKMDGDFSTAPFASEHTAKLGQTVFTVGFPMPEIQGFSPKVTKGVISSINGIQDDPDMYQIDAAIQPGNSGGPLADDRGRVVGIVVARLNDAVLAENTGVGAQNVNFAIKNIVIREHLEKRPDVMAETFAMESPVASTFEEAVEKIRKATVLVMVY